VQKGEHWISSERDYELLLPHLYPRPVPIDREHWREIARLQERGEIIFWITLEGFFWWPRRLLGIEPHMYAFYDQAELMKRINQDQANYMRECIEAICSICTPDFMTFAEDMSYNHGPMISKNLFDDFMAPYYRQVVPELKRRGIIPMIDSDGDVEPLIPWFEQVGLEGILPLERMAGVDVDRIRRGHPRWKMIGGFDKTVMHKGEAAVRAEFDRLLPVMRSGYFIPSVDHQTPPGVSMEQYGLYLKLLNEYAQRAVK
jgi:uroporphyrinogen-III decarboxylase